MGELDEAVDNQPDQDRDQYAPPNQCQRLPPSGGGLVVRLLPEPAVAVAITVIGISGRLIGSIVRRVVPCHGR